MHSQNPDTTGMRDLPPLREPAPPPLPQWRNHQSGPKHIEEVEAYVNRLHLYEDSKAAYKAELAKRRSPPLNLTIDGENVIVDGVPQTTTSQAAEAAKVAQTVYVSIPGTSMRVEAPLDILALVKVWRVQVSLHKQRWSVSATLYGKEEREEGATLEAAVRSLCDRLALRSRTEKPTEWPDDLNQPAPVAETTPPTTLAEVVPPKPNAWQGLITSGPKGTSTVTCSLTVTGDTVLITTPTADDMQALTLACYNAEHHPAIVIDGKNPPIFARIVKVECNHLDGLATAECVLTLKRCAAAAAL